MQICIYGRKLTKKLASTTFVDKNLDNWNKILNNFEHFLKYLNYQRTEWKNFFICYKLNKRLLFENIVIIHWSNLCNLFIIILIIS